jgi:hypothetical protein
LNKIQNSALYSELREAIQMMVAPNSGDLQTGGPVPPGEGGNATGGPSARGKGAPFSRYILRRITQAVPLVIIIVTLNFFLIHLAPGDAGPVYGGPPPTPANNAEINEH